MINSLELFLGSRTRLQFILWLANLEGDTFTKRDYRAYAEKLDMNVDSHLQRLRERNMVSVILRQRPDTLSIWAIRRDHPYWDEVVPLFQQGVEALERVQKVGRHR